MVAVYVTSLNGPEGKTTLCVGLARKWHKAGKKVGYVKPVLVSATEQTSPSDADAAFVKKVLGLIEPAESLCPLSLTAQGVAGVSKLRAPEQKLVKACTDIAAGKDILLMEGLTGQTEASAAIVRWLGAKAIIVVHHSTALADELPKAVKPFGQALAGVVINAVPRERLDEVSANLAPALRKVGIKVLGALPQERALAGPSVRDLVEPLQARAVTFKDGMNATIENVMGGAVFLDPGPLYFERKSNKAVVVRIDRPDVQLGALETSIRCLVLTNAEGDPNPYVYYKAQDKGTPILLTKMDTHAALAAVESTLNNTRFREEHKLRLLEDVLDHYLDFGALNKALGI
ncbi:MAG: phosphotransacetylase family protein [Chloroflexi bacterium]|nr:phosphotransacetylase family protein [Chloroflexota bacterium]